MKVFLLLVLVALAASAPQPRKLFHEHVEEFLDIIMEDAGHDLEHLMNDYLVFDEFKATFDYLTTNNFKNLVYEMESLPEFQAVIELLENDNIDIHYFLDLFNEALSNMGSKKRHTLSGTDFHAFVKDSIAEFPKDKLNALYQQKIAEDDDFRTAIENLASDEFRQAMDALFNNEVFKKEVDDLEANGIILADLFDELMAIFGQN